MLTVLINYDILFSCNCLTLCFPGRDGELIRKVTSTRRIPMFKSIIASLSLVTAIATVPAIAHADCSQHQTNADNAFTRARAHERNANDLRAEATVFANQGKTIEANQKIDLAVEADKNATSEWSYKDSYDKQYAACVAAEEAAKKAAAKAAKKTTQKSE